MAATFHRKTGHQNCRRFPSSGSMGVNTLCQFDEGGEIAAHATNKSVLGIVLEAATSSTEPLVDILTERDVIEARGVGVTIQASTVGDHVDVTTGNEISLTDTNKDALVVAWDGITASKCDLVFKKCAYGSSVLP